MINFSVAIIAITRFLIWIGAIGLILAMGIVSTHGMTELSFLYQSDWFVKGATIVNRAPLLIYPVPISLIILTDHALSKKLTRLAKLDKKMEAADE